MTNPEKSPISKPHARTVLAASLAAMLLAGCGGSGTDTSTGSGTDDSFAGQLESAGQSAKGVLLAAQDWVQSAYLENFRPQLSFTPAKNWMNDPNGLVYYDGEYHLFYQYNPNGNDWGDMSWGHAVSTDLVHWSEKPIAIPVEKDAAGNPIEMFFSGSAVVDYANTSGFGTASTPPMVAMFTSFYPVARTLANGKTVQEKTQAQGIAFSNDRGRTWTRHPGNPVIEKPPAPYEAQYQEFRDPKVFWYEPQKKWVMVAVLSQLRKALLYSSTNLVDWTYMSEFGPSNATGGVWECPDLFELPVDGDPAKTKWVMQINLNPGSVAKGSGAHYYIGNFNGTHFNADPDNVYDNSIPAGTVHQNFETGTFASLGWTATGDFAGGSPVPGLQSGQSRLADTFFGSDTKTGTLTSPPFAISSKYINFQMAGGLHPYQPNAGNGTPPAGTALFSAAGFEAVAGARYADIGWSATGDFVGQQIARGTLPGQQNVTGFTGSGLINSFFGQLIGRGGDDPQGRLTSPTFTVTKSYINFLVGGGNHPYALGNSTSVVLMVNGAVVRSATGKNDEHLDWTNWNVSEFIGRQAQIVIVDENAGGWGHISADDFQASDQAAYPRSDELSVNLLVDGKVVYSETGDDNDPLTWRSWNVAGLMGKQAQIRIVDKNAGEWGHLLVDNIIFSDQPKLQANWLDYGSDFYAAITWDNVQGRRLGLGWLSNWKYAGVTPTSPWRGAQTMAREFRLRTIDGKVRMVMLPAAELTTLRNKLLYSVTGASLSNGEKKLNVSSQSKAYEIQARIAPGTATGFGVKVHTGTNGEETVVGYDVATGQVYLDRSRSNDTGVLPPTFFTRHNAPLPYRGRPINLRIVVDTSSVTVYAGNEVVLTDVIFPDPNSNGISLFAQGGDAKLHQVNVWSLTSIWAK